MLKKLIVAPALASTAMFLVSPAHAQTADPSSSVDESNDLRAQNESALGDIIVTARRRAESAQDVPLAVTAISGARLEEAGVASVADLSRLAPQLNLVRNSTNPTSLFPFIRGFGTKSSDPAAEPPISLSIDGIYLGTVIGAFVNLADVEAVEVLRGPQGTLEGKNAPAGSVSIRTRRPDFDFGGAAKVGYGNFSTLTMTGHVDVPIVADKFTTTFSAYHEQSAGYMRNLNLDTRNGGADLTSFRAAGLLDLDSVNWYVSVQYDIDKGEDAGNRNNSTSVPLVVPGADYSEVPPRTSSTCSNAFSASLCEGPNPIVPNTERYTTYGSEQPDRNSRAFMVSSNLDVDAGPVAFTSVTGYRRFKEHANSDIDGTPLAIIDSEYRGIYRQFSQELRVASSDGGGLDMDGRLNWLLGVYYFNLDYTRFNNSIVRGNLSRTYQEGVTNSYAVFAHAEYEIVDGLTLSGGVRQTWDKKSHVSCAARCFAGLDPYFSVRASWNNFSYDATLQYDISQDHMVFVRYATGYRGGGFTGVPSTAAVVGSFDPETVKAIEFGSKSDFFDGRARVNLTVFRNTYDDLQRTITVGIPVAPFFLQKPENIASARTQGVEAEVLVRPVPALTLRGSVGYLDAKYTDFFANITGISGNPPTQNTGLQFPYTSDWTASAGMTYEQYLGSAGSLTAVVDYAFKSDYNVTDLNFADWKQDGFGLLSASLTWRDSSDRFSLSVYGQNLTDEYYIDGGDPIGGLTSFVSEGMPRTYGVSAGVKF